MNKELESFLGIALSADGAVDLASTRRSLPRRGPTDLRQLQSDFLDLVDHRRLTLREWGKINDLDFDDEDALYAYLRAAYAYLFEDGATPPTPPWL